MLHNALIALATAFSDDPRIRDLKARQYFANKAKSYIDVECQQANLNVVHALSTIASFHSTLGDQTLGYLYFGEIFFRLEFVKIHVYNPSFLGMSARMSQERERYEGVHKIPRLVLMVLWP